MLETDVDLVSTLDIAGSRGPQGWVAWQLENYATHGFGLWIIETHSGEFVGDCGLTMQEIEGEWHIETGWHVRRDLRGQGFATEAATAVCASARTHALDRLVAIIRPENLASHAVARKIGMTFDREVQKFGGAAWVFALDL